MSIVSLPSAHDVTTSLRPAILGTGSYLPERVLTNEDLEGMVDTSDEWIVERTGIHQRRLAGEGETTSTLAARAAKLACEQAGVESDEIDLIIVATSTPDMVFPSTACLVQKEIGAYNAGAFDLAAACSGFLYALTTGASFVRSRMAKRVLVIGAETMSKIVDYQDRTTCILFGDGAGAVVLGAGVNGSGLIYSQLGADGRGASLMQVPAGGSLLPASSETVADRLHFMKFHGRAVFKFAVNTMRASIEEAMLRCELTPDQVGLVVPHQVNERIIEAAIKKLNLPREKFYLNLDRYGNTSAASVPIALDEARRDGRIKPGDHVILVAFGGGLTWATNVVRM